MAGCAPVDEAAQTAAVAAMKALSDDDLFVWLQALEAAAPNGSRNALSLLDAAIGHLDEGVAPAVLSSALASGAARTALGAADEAVRARGLQLCAKMLRAAPVVLCDRLRRTSGALEEIALFDLPAGLARLLVKLAADYGKPHEGGGIRIGMKLSQRDLSSLVASTRESINKQLRIWRQAGTIDLVDNHIVLLQPQNLRALYN
jgi:hypothetical protein